MTLRDDLQLIYDWIPQNAHVLDLGCGNGELLGALMRHKHCTGYGIEIDPDSVQAALARGVNVIQADLERGLAAFADHSFDVIVLSQTIQAMQNRPPERPTRCGNALPDLPPSADAGRIARNRTGPPFCAD